MQFENYIPCDILKPYVKSFAIQGTDDETTYTVLPDTSLVMGFQFKGKLAMIDHQKEIPLASSGISGIADRYRTFKNSPDIGTLLVFFKEAGAAVFFKQPLHELFHESLSLDNFILRSELFLLEEQLYEAKTNKARIKIIEAFLISQLASTEQDKLVFEALQLIHQSNGNIRIKELMQQLHISQSPLEKRFRKIVGASPKKFANIVRFKHAIQNYKDNNSMTSLGYDSGFYDQAHFIKEFKSFTGETPEKFFKNK
jgi:AraC-like DNA-binding protein